MNEANEVSGSDEAGDPGIATNGSEAARPDPQDRDLEARPAASNGAGLDRRPKTILVLGGGGMRGFAHIGVVRAMESLGLKIDEVVGTSIGALMGCAVAAGLSSVEIEDLCNEINIKDYFKIKLLKFLVKGYRHASVYKGKIFHDMLRKMLPAERFEDLRKPFFCNALSITDGTTRYFGLPGGPQPVLPDAVYASCALPGIFEPLEIDGDWYIDGGMVETIGLRLAHARSPDLIVAVDLSLRDHHASVPYRASLPHILFQTYEIMGNALNEHSLHHYARLPNLVLIKPKVADVGLLASVDVKEVVRRGEREAMEALTTHPLTRYLCDAELVKDVDRTISAPRDYVHIDVDMNACVNCGICAVTCATEGFTAVPFGNVVRKLYNYECTRDSSCERNCPAGAVRLRNI